MIKALRWVAFAGALAGSSAAGVIAGVAYVNSSAPLRSAPAPVSAPVTNPYCEDALLRRRQAEQALSAPVTTNWGATKGIAHQQRADADNDVRRYCPQG